MRALVTGGCGFIGSTLVDTLIKKNNSVIVIDNESADSHEHFYYNDKAEYHIKDICDDSTKELYSNVDYVFHMAAETRIQDCIKNPILASKTNSHGTCCVLQNSLENGVKRVMFSSTSAIYGLNDSPNKETQSPDCLNPYSTTKLCGEELCKMYSKLYGLETIIFRYFNVFGDRSPIKGQYSPVISRFLDQKKNNKPLTIVPDGEQRRDYIHVDDVVSANILSSTVTLEEYGQIFNIGSGENYSVNELAKIISDEKIYLDPRDGEARVTLADINKTRELLLWNPTKNLKQWIESKL